MMSNQKSVMIFIAIAMLSFLLSSSGASAILNPGSSSCNSDGTADFQLSYYGGKINFNEAEVTALKTQSGQMFNLSGEWISGSAVFLGNDLEQAFPKFKSEKRFTSKGIYAVTFMIADEGAVFTVSCPGVSCKLNVNCKESEICNQDSVCEELVCKPCEYAKNHECTDRCNDGNMCTRDSCVNGACENKYISNCCLTDRNCNDGLLCTKDNCKGYRCEYEPVACQKKQECMDAVCREFLGCVDELNQTCVKEKNRFRSFFETSLIGKILKALRIL